MRLPGGEGNCALRARESVATRGQVLMPPPPPARVGKCSSFSSQSIIGSRPPLSDAPPETRSSSCADSSHISSAGFVPIVPLPMITSVVVVSPRLLHRARAAYLLRLPPRGSRL